MIKHDAFLLMLSFFAAFAISTVQAVRLASNTSGVTAAPLSGCQVCAASGDCSHAYLDGPGQFCGNWLDRASQRQRCCCPREATCAVSNYACNCKTSKTAAPVSSSSTTSSSSSRASWGTIFGCVIILFIASSILWCLCPCCRANKYAALSQPAMAPVVVQTPAYAPEYAYTPGYASRPVYGGPVYGGGGYSNGGIGVGSSAMLGGVAGLFGGILAGQALSDAGGHHGYNGGGGTRSADNGGEEFGGDF